jgi:hypothetical protein
MYKILMEISTPMRDRISRGALLAVFAGIAFYVPAAAQQTVPLVAPATVLLSSPLDYQVFQRESRLMGTVSIRGRSLAPAKRAEARVVGKRISGPLTAKWLPLSLDQQTGEFHGDLKAAAGGFYEVDVRIKRAGHGFETLTVPHVGVGEVFVVSGQSNSTNYGEVPQVTETGMVSSFNGDVWQLANDPQIGVQDNSKKGSFIPSFGDDLYRKYGVPIGVASVGHGSTSVRQWLPAGEPVEVMPTMTKYVVEDANGTLISDGTLFNGMMVRIHQLGVHGFRAVLWHQGESDSHQKPEHEISGETYRRMLEEVILATRREAGWDIPWFVAEASYGTPEIPSWEPVREAQQSLWLSGVALPGPDTDTLGPAYRQNNGKGVHFNDAGLKAHGLLWAHRVELYLDPLLR